MTKITLDLTACRQLDGIDDSAEIYDEKGRIIGYFVPGDRKPGQLPPEFEIPISLEETEKRRNSRMGRTTEEILKGLGL